MPSCSARDGVRTAPIGTQRREAEKDEIALGSAKELRSVVDAAIALGYVAHVSEIGRDDLEHVIAVLINLSR